MKNKKKLIIIIIIAVLVAACIAAGLYFFVFKKDNEQDLNEIVDGRISAYETDLRDSLASMTDQESVVKYLTNWAEHKKIDYKSDKNNNVIFDIPASEGYEDQDPVVILCDYDYYCMESYINSLTTALTVAKNDQPHCAYSIIFISSDEGSLQGAEGLSSSYFPDNAKVFYLSNSISSRISQITGGYENYSISKDLQTTSPNYKKTYRIVLSGITPQTVGSKSASSPNPIKTLGSLLASLKSSSIFFELSSFEGGSDADVTPVEASVTILIPDSSSTKLEKKLDSAIEKFYDKYEEKYPNMQYTYEVIDTPSDVLSTEDTESIISLLYTALNGVYSKDNSGNIEALTNIGYVNTKSNHFTMDVSAVSYNSELLSEISEAYQTISYLSGVDYNIVSQQPIYEATTDDQALEDAFRESYLDYQNIKLETLSLADFTPCSIIREKNPVVPIAVLGVTDKTKDNFAGGLITYLATKANIV